jgi:hypothetical protein
MTPTLVIIDALKNWKREKIAKNEVVKIKHEAFIWETARIFDGRFL